MYYVSSPPFLFNLKTGMNEEQFDRDYQIRFILSNIIEMIKDIKDVLRTVVQDRDNIREKLDDIEDILNRLSVQIESLKDKSEVGEKYRDLLQSAYDNALQNRKDQQQLFIKLLLTGFIVGLILPLFPFIALAIVDPSILVELLKLVVGN